MRNRINEIMQQKLNLKTAKHFAKGTWFLTTSEAVVLMLKTFKETKELKQEFQEWTYTRNHMRTEMKKLVRKLSA